MSHIEMEGKTAMTNVNDSSVSETQMGDIIANIQPRPLSKHIRRVLWDPLDNTP